MFAINDVEFWSNHNVRKIEKSYLNFGSISGTNVSQLIYTCQCSESIIKCVGSNRVQRIPLPDYIYQVLIYLYKVYSFYG